MIRLACLALGALLAAGCDRLGAGADGRLDPAAVEARVATAHLHRHLTQLPRTLDPSLNEDVGAYAIADDLFEGLVRLDAAGRIVPGVAERWEHDAEAQVWRFHLRAGARWSNGAPVTADDFLFAWRRVLDPATNSPAAQQLLPLAGAAAIIRGEAPPATLGVARIDAHTLEVRLASPTPYFLYLLTNCWLKPLHAPTLQAHGARWTEPGRLVGNGAFRLVARETGGTLTLARNPHYWDAAAVKLAGVTYHPMPDTAAATARFLAGDLDVTDRFQVDDLGWLRQALGEQVRLEPYFGTFMLAMQVTRAPFDDSRLRRALLLAVDREILAGKVLKGLFLPAHALVPPLPGYDGLLPRWSAQDAAARLDEARALYAAAGYSASHPLEIELWYPTADADTRRTLEAVSAMWRLNLGAQVHLANEEWRVHQQNRRIRKHALFFYPWIGDYPDPLTFLGLPLPDSPQNYMNYDSAEFTDAVEAGRRAVDPLVRGKSWRDAERVLDRDAVVIPLYYYQSRHLLRSHVRGWQPNVMDRHASQDLWLAHPEAR